METIQMVDLKRRYARLKSEIDKATTDVMAAGSFIGGPEVDAFTRELGQYLNAPHIIPCANGTDALELALRALGVQPGDEVIMPAFTYIAAAEMVALLGATPVLIDVRPDTYNIDPALVEQAVSRQTKAIVVVHLFGQTCDMDPILRVAKKYKLGVIEDNAQHRHRDRGRQRHGQGDEAASTGLTGEGAGQESGEEHQNSLFRRAWRQVMRRSSQTDPGPRWEP